jgi:hypothetical protein
LEAFEWPFGQKTVNARKENVGLARSWIDFAWPNPAAEAGLHVILEDDVTVSPVFWSWLRKDTGLAATRSDVAGLSLQRPTLRATDGAHLARIGPADAPFLYRLVGSIGFAPRAEVWQDFRAWHQKTSAHGDPTSGATVSGLVTSKWYRKLAQEGRASSMWTQWFIAFCADRNLYTLYQNPRQGALASHWREKGEHAGGSQGADFPACSPGDVAMDTVNSANIPKYDWSAQPAKGESFAQLGTQTRTQTKARPFVRGMGSNVHVVAAANMPADTGDDEDSSTVASASGTADDEDSGEKVKVEDAPSTVAKDAIGENADNDDLEDSLVKENVGFLQVDASRKHRPASGGDGFYSRLRFGLLKGPEESAFLQGFFHEPFSNSSASAVLTAVQGVDDPLEERAFLQGFFHEPFSNSSASADPSAVQGVDDPRLQEYLGPDAARALTSELQRLRQSASRVVIAAFTVEMREIAENWLCSAAASKERNTGILMVGLYAGACQNFPTTADCLAIEPKGAPAATQDVVYQSKKYIHSTIVKHAVFTLAVSSGYFDWVLLSDVDVVLLAPSFSYVDQMVGGPTGDFIFMRGNPETTGISIPNSGFYYVRSTPKSRQIMWASLDNIFKGRTYDGGDQGAITQALEDFHVAPAYLPSSLYPNGAILVKHPESLDPAPRAFHLNYIKKLSEKIRCMKAAHCWSRNADGTCSATCSAQQAHGLQCKLEGALLLQASTYTRVSSAWP